MHGCGNDFILIDNRGLDVPVEAMAGWAKALCRRNFSIGADGLIFLDAAPSELQADFIWHFYNADGTRAEMCGNASRCAAKLAVMLGLAGPGQVFGTDAGLIRASVEDGGRTVKSQLTPPKDMKMDITLNVDDTQLTVHFVNTGVPHAVCLCAELDAVDVPRLGRAIRIHPRFAPAGTNVNFISVVDRTTIRLRTYERGVEGETWACGTGAVASEVIAHALGLTESEVQVITSGGEQLSVMLEGDATFLAGPAELVFFGELAEGSVPPLSETI